MVATVLKTAPATGSRTDAQPRHAQDTALLPGCREPPKQQAPRPGDRASFRRLLGGRLRDPPTTHGSTRAAPAAAGRSPPSRAHRQAQPARTRRSGPVGLQRRGAEVAPQRDGARRQANAAQGGAGEPAPRSHPSRSGDDCTGEPLPPHRAAAPRLRPRPRPCKALRVRADLHDRLPGDGRSTAPRPGPAAAPSAAHGPARSESVLAPLTAAACGPCDHRPGTGNKGLLRRFRPAAPSGIIAGQAMRV